MRSFCSIFFFGHSTENTSELTQQLCTQISNETRKITHSHSSRLAGRVTDILLKSIKAVLTNALLINSSFYSKDQITRRLLLFKPVLMNILLGLPAKQITLITPERSFFLHQSPSEGQASRTQTHWNRHGGIREFMKLPN